MVASSVSLGRVEVFAKAYRSLEVGRICGIWGSYYRIPKAIFYLLKGDYTLKLLVFEASGFRVWGLGFSWVSCIYGPQLKRSSPKSPMRGHGIDVCESKNGG